MSKLFGMALLCSTFALSAHADDHYWHTHTGEQESFFKHSDGAGAAVAAPEVDPASALSGLTLLLGGIAVVRGRRK